MIAETIIHSVQEHLKVKDRIIVSVSGTQGSGKTTITKLVADRLANECHIPAIAVSIDDFYKPYDKLMLLAQKGNPLLKHRGLPGTHDTSLLYQFVNDFVDSKPGLQIPQYDKSQHNGAGDRIGIRNVPNDTKVILLEGWMVGFKPVGPEILASCLCQVNDLKLTKTVTLDDMLEIDNNLANYVPIWNKCDEHVLLHPKSLEYVYKWRLQQEHELWISKRTGMSDAQVKEFVDQYMPCYLVYNRTLPKPPMVYLFELDEDHNVVKA